MIRYHFDLYPRDDPKDGARLVRFTKLQSAEYRAEANGTGAGKITLRGDTTDAGFIDPAGLQYVRVVREDTVAVTEEVIGGFFLDSGDFMALDEKGTRLLTFGGAGTLSYLAREVLWSRSYFYAADVPIIDSTWHFYDQPSILGGDFLGAVLYRVMQEAGSFASPVVEIDDKPETAIPDASTGASMGVSNDSAGNAWTVPSGEFKAQIGENILAIVKRLMESGLYIEMNPDTFVINAWEQVAWPGHTLNSRGQDKSGAAWGLVGGVGTTYIVRFQSPTDGTIATGDVLSDAKRAVAPFTPRSAILAGDNGTYVVESVVSDVPWHGFYPNDSQDADTLSHMAVSQIGARSGAGDTLRVRMKHGTDAANGEYIPLSDYDQGGVEPSGVVMLNDLVTVHTGTGQWDYNEDTFPVAALNIVLREGGDWDAWADLGSSYTSMAERAFQARGVGTHNHPPNPQFCRDTLGAAFSSPLELLMRFRFRMAVTTQRHHLEMLIKDNTGATQLQWVIDNGAGGAWSDQMSVGALVLDDQAASNTDGPATDGILATVDDVWCFARIRADTTGQAMIRLWKDGSSEPGTWDVETDDAPVDVDGSVPLINRLDFNIRAGNSGSGSSVEIDWIEFTEGFSGPSTESFNRVVASGAGASDWNGTAYDGRTANLSVDGSVLIDVEGVGDSGTVWGLDFAPAVSTCIHGGPAANSGDASEACGMKAAPCNHEHDYVAAGGTTGQVLKKVSDSDWDTEWDAESGGAPTTADFLVGTAQAGLSAEIVVGATPGGELGGTWAAPTVDATHAGGTHAPTAADYLVGTAQAGLSAEIVVGATPGGELGGTWAAPTVDATHSGSAHHTESHQTRHANGGADEVAVEGLPTAETDPALVLHPDGAGGIVWGTDEVGGSGIAGELVTDTIIGDGVEDTFALSEAPTGSWALVSTNGADLLPTEYAISGSDIIFDVAPVNLAEVLVTFITGGFTVPATDPGDIADPTLATAEDVANKVNDLMAELRTAGIIA